MLCLIDACAKTNLVCLQLLIYQMYGAVNYYLSAFLLFVTGLFVNGPYALITTAVSADLGTSVHAGEGNSRALSTVTAIIDGTGSVGKFRVAAPCKFLRSSFFYLSSATRARHRVSVA